MVEDGYHHLSVHLAFAGEAATNSTLVTLWGSNDLDPDDAAADFVDITREVFGVDQFASGGAPTLPGTQEVQMSLASITYRRCYWRIRGYAYGGTVKMYYIKAAMGSAYNPNIAHDFAALELGPQNMGIARDSQATEVDEDDAVRMVCNLNGELVLANHTWATRSNRVEEIDPLDTRDTPSILADAETITGGATDDYYLLLEHFKGFSIQFISTEADTELKVYAANRDDGTALSALEYTDVTDNWFGAATIVAGDQFILFDQEMCAYAIHIEITQPAGDSADYKLFARRNF